MQALDGVDLCMGECMYAGMLDRVPCLLLDERLEGCGARVANVGVIQKGEGLLQVVPLLLVAAGREHLQEQLPSA